MSPSDGQVSADTGDLRLRPLRTEPGVPAEVGNRSGDSATASSRSVTDHSRAEVPDQSSLDLPNQQREAVEAPPSIGLATYEYLCGPAGSGKTFIAREFAENLANGALLTATTGIAALNLGAGTTINAALGYFDTKSLQDLHVAGFLSARLGKLWKIGIRRIVLDEASMLDGDQLTLLVHGIEELGGRGYTMLRDEGEESHAPAMGLTLVGDFAQLRPVKAPLAFESSEWARTDQNQADRFAEQTRILTRIHRQAEREFVDALRAARVGDGRTVAAYFQAHGGFQAVSDDRFEGPTILAKNEAVEKYNWLRLDKVPGQSVIYPSERWGQQRSEWGNPNKPPFTWGIPPRLNLKIGALIMVLANKRVEGPPPQPYLYVNGDSGTLVQADVEQRLAYVQLQRTGETVPVDYVRREVKVPCDAPRRKELREQGKAELISDDGRWEIMGWIDYLPLRLAYASTVHKCVAYGTKIAVSQRGVLPVENAHIGDWIDTGAGEFARLIATEHQEKELYRIMTAAGYSVTCTSDHRWKTHAGMKATEDLIVGTDRLVLTQPSVVDGTQAIDRDMAWWIGATVGDGNYTDRREGQIHFSGTSPFLRQRWMKIAQRLGGRPNTRRDDRGCHLTSLPIRLRLEAWGLDYVTALSKRTPRIIFEAGRAAWAAYLQGLFDTDGGIDNHRLVYCSRSCWLADDVQYLLLLLGIPTTRGIYTADYMGTDIEYYHIRVTAAGLDKFKALVGFSAPQKVKLLRAWTPNRIVTKFDGTDVVAKVEKLDVAAPVIDVELETIHELGFNGIVGSNSQGLSLDRVQVNIRDPFFKEPGMVYVALSRARTAAGLRLVGTPASLIERCTCNPKLKDWL